MDQITGKSAEMVSWPKGIFAITLFVEDLAAAKKFYQVVFGMPVEMVTRKIRSDADQKGMLIYGYKFRPVLNS